MGFYIERFFIVFLMLSLEAHQPKFYHLGNGVIQPDIVVLNESIPTSRGIQLMSFYKRLQGLHKVVLPEV